MRCTLPLWALALTAGAALAAGTGEAKIGVVDMARIMDAYPDTKAAEVSLDKQKADFEKERKDMLEEFRALRDQYEEARKEAENPAWSEPERKKKAEAAQAKLALLDDKRQLAREKSELAQKQLSDQTLRMRQRILEKLRQIVSEYAEKNGYTLVLDGAVGVTSLPPVIYRQDALDITDAILKIIAPEPPADKDTTDKPAAKP